MCLMNWHTHLMTSANWVNVPLNKEIALTKKKGGDQILVPQEYLMQKHCITAASFSRRSEAFPEKSTSAVVGRKRQFEELLDFQLHTVQQEHGEDEQ